MELVEEMSFGVVQEYRESQKHRLQRTFVSGSDAAEARVNRGLIDSLSQPTDPVSSDPYFHTYRQSVRPYFLKTHKTKQTSHENSVCYWWDCGSGQGDL